MITPATLARTGTLAYFLKDGIWREEPTRRPHVQRPWMPRLPPAPAEVSVGTAEDAEADAASP
ncbi:hypothetical protein EZH22_20785 [Xanthobacter dioxanivorans]|uniref:Uncharacterized protein n=1 Tax=Xanthobacter dioxanivorans TaxID=2528964 RepID=A0A974PLE2_9HYPH|nr:hypothetical protein [Xanthobacter dioxanivorans]QRG05493.1 hypothetical protein EZH22_20785 [Xanthobacter dioxanivorans]